MWNFLNLNLKKRNTINVRLQVRVKTIFQHEMDKTWRQNWKNSNYDVWYYPYHFSTTCPKQENYIDLIFND